MKQELTTYLDEEHPPPALVPKDTTHPEEAGPRHGGKDIGRSHGYPEIAESDAHLGVLVKVRQVQDNLKAP